MVSKLFGQKNKVSQLVSELKTSDKNQDDLVDIDELKEALSKFSPAERAAYVLMDRIQPPSKTATLVRGGESIVGACVCELGIYGTILTNGEGATIFENTPGHLLRQKSLGVDEGGVAAGFACLSSPALV